MLAIGVADATGLLADGFGGPGVCLDTGWGDCDPTGVEAGLESWDGAGAVVDAPDETTGTGAGCEPTGLGL